MAEAHPAEIAPHCSVVRLRADPLSNRLEKWFAAKVAREIVLNR